MRHALDPMIEALMAKQLVRHPDMQVNISVACCVCEIMRIMAPETPSNDEQFKDFFEMVVSTFEKLSSVPGRCYATMTKVLNIFSNIRLPVLLLDPEAHIRLFKQFLTVADSNSSAIVLKMEKIMTMIIEESKCLAPELVALLVTSVKKDNQIASPVCWQLGVKILTNCADHIKPHLPNIVRNMGIDHHDYSEMVACICNGRPVSEAMQVAEVGNSLGETIPLQKVKLEDLEEGIINMNVHCQLGTTDTVSPQGIHSGDKENHEKGTLPLSDDPPVPSKSVPQGKRKRKRNSTQLKQKAIPENVSSPKSGMCCVHGYKIRSSLAPTLTAILTKYGDIAAECIFQTLSVRSSFLKVVCKVVKQIQTSNVTTIITKLEEIERHVSDAEAANINVSWLWAHLAPLQKRKKAMKKLMEIKSKTALVKKSAQVDEKERYAKFLVAQERFIKAQRCAKVLDLVETKLNDSVLEHKAGADSWLKQPII
uniref:uncharacterized protein LOC122594451 n=1 Tax=Erigeron canadensis TaxID=72917 RepID=UPI001CB8F770|nr:uncharacterized protein LOC122594451 [Erigeron canadensis]